MAARLPRRTQPHLLLALAVSLGCGDPAVDAPPSPAPATLAPAPTPTAPAPPVEAPSEPAAPEPSEPTAPAADAALAEPGTNVPPAVRLTPPLSPATGTDAIRGAIDPAADAVTLGAEITLGETRYVLYTIDAAAAATAALRSREHGEELLVALEDLIAECADGNFVRRFDCAARLAPDPAFAIAAWEIVPTGIGIVRVENGVVTARRSLFAASSSAVTASLSSADLDGDGRLELLVEMDVAVQTAPGDANEYIDPTGASGTLVYFLDGDLQTRFRFARRIVSNLNGNVECTFDYELRDTDGDGHTDLHFERACLTEDVAEPVPVSIECLAVAGRFTCPPVGTFFFDPAVDRFAETSDELRARVGGVGTRFREVEARAERERAELEEDTE